MKSIHTYLFIDRKSSIFPVKVYGFLVLLSMLLFACGGKKEKNPSIDPAEINTVPAPQQKAPGPYDKLIPKWSKMEGIESLCAGSKMNLAVPINIIAANISKDSLAYNEEPFSDCSGVFLRVLDSLEKRCPKHLYPDPSQYRDSRALALWFHEQGNLIRIKDPLLAGDYLKPGMVMFYGGRGAKNEELTLEDLFAPGGINHVGVITVVDKGTNGKVKGYSLFHGRRPGKLASTTHFHKRSYRNRSNYPPFGNGTEAWVAVAPILETEDAFFSR